MVEQQLRPGRIIAANTPDYFNRKSVVRMVPITRCHKYRNAASAPHPLHFPHIRHQMHYYYLVDWDETEVVWRRQQQLWRGQRKQPNTIDFLTLYPVETQAAKHRRLSYAVPCGNGRGKCGGASTLIEDRRSNSTILTKVLLLYTRSVFFTDFVTIKSVNSHSTTIPPFYQAW